MAFSISDNLMNSSAACERLLSPGPSLSEGNDISAWSDRVGEPKGTIPMATHRCTNGCCGSMCEECRRKERALTSLFRC